jgi:hypothetical protein
LIFAIAMPPDAAAADYFADYAIISPYFDDADIATAFTLAIDAIDSCFSLSAADTPPIFADYAMLSAACAIDYATPLITPIFSASFRHFADAISLFSSLLTLIC